MTEQRRLAAIVLTDVARYSRLMGATRVARAVRRRVPELPAWPSYTALANARRARSTRRL
jgi:hypothetical protein